MQKLDLERLKAYRLKTYRLLPLNRVSNPAGALDFVNERGFVFFWPIKGFDLPSLWMAVAGERSVTNNHDDPGHVTWGWKDAALPDKIWYYGKILRRKATIISMEIAPFFYALSWNFGSPEEDYLLAYQEGRLTQAARQIFETILEKGVLDTISLRKAARLLNAKESVFNRAMEDLQMDFKILPVGIAQAGAWKYSFRYDLTSRHLPLLPEQAHQIGESVARRKLMEIYFASIGAAQTRDVARLFGWPLELVKRTLDGLTMDGSLVDAVHPLRPGFWLTLPELCVRP
jgi:hypothetical protein